MDRTAAPRRAWPVALAVLALMALLAGGWPLVGSWLPDGENLPADIGLRLGPDSETAARLPLAGTGWRLSRSASNPDQQYALRHGTVGLEATYVQLEEPADAGELWTGLRKLGELSDATIGTPAAVTGAGGLAGESAPLTENGLSGTVTVFVHPDRRFAVVLKQLAPPGAADADRAAVRASVLGVSFAEPT
jgi:hypothetical protein